MRRNAKLLVWTLLLALLATGGIAISAGINARANAEEARQNLHAIQLAIERYGVDDEHGSYPLTLSQLAEAGFLPYLPRNPYGRHRAAADSYEDHLAQAMPEVPLGQHTPGGVTYLPQITEIYDERTGETRQEVTDYALLVYGDTRRPDGPNRTSLPGGEEGQVAWEYVLMVLEIGVDYKLARAAEQQDA